LDVDNHLDFHGFQIYLKYRGLFIHKLKKS